MYVFRILCAPFTLAIRCLLTASPWPPRVNTTWDATQHRDRRQADTHSPVKKACPMGVDTTRHHHTNPAAPCLLV